MSTHGDYSPQARSAASAADFTLLVTVFSSLTLVGMGTIVNAVKTANPPADVIMLPFELMSTLAIDGGVTSGTFTPLGRSEMGLAVRAGAPHPDISTIDKLVAVLRGAKSIAMMDQRQ